MLHCAQRLLDLRHLGRRGRAVLGALRAGADLGAQVHRKLDPALPEGLVLLTCLTDSSPVPSRDRLIATTTTRAIVMVRLRLRPIHTSWKTNCARMSSLSLGSPRAAGQ